MTEPKPPKKRVVSKSQYVAHLAEKTTLKSGSVLLWIGGVMCAAGAIISCLLSLITLVRSELPYIGESCLYIALTVYLGLTAWAFIRGGRTAQFRCNTMEPVLPPTRQNIEQLSAKETLVRASTEPTEGQEKVLLRAATGSAETPPEQLLRAGK